MIPPAPIPKQVSERITRRCFVALPLAGVLVSPAATTQQVEDLVIVSGWVVKRSEIRITVLSQK